MAKKLHGLTRGRLFALVFGVGYLTSGLAAFLFSSGLTGGSADDKLLFFRTNYVHAIVHVLLGVGWLLASRRADWAKSVNLAFGVVLLLLAIVGFSGADIMHTLINASGEPVDADNFLHLFTGLPAIFYGTIRAGEGSDPAKN